MYKLYKTPEGYTIRNQVGKAVSYNVRFIVEAIGEKKSEELLSTYNGKEPEKFLRNYIEINDKDRLLEIEEQERVEHHKSTTSHEHEIKEHEEKQHHLFHSEDVGKTHLKPEGGGWSSRGKFNGWNKLMPSNVVPQWLMAGINKISHSIRTRGLNFRRRFYKSNDEQ